MPTKPNSQIKARYSELTGAQVKAALKSVAWSEADMARLCGLNTKTMYNITSGLKDGSISVLFELALEKMLESPIEHHRRPEVQTPVKVSRARKMALAPPKALQKDGRLVSAPIATIEQVHEACSAIIARGEQLNVQKLRAEIPGRAPINLDPFIKKWKERVLQRDGDRASWPNLIRSDKTFSGNSPPVRTRS